MKSDLEIAYENEMLPIDEIAKKLDIEDDIELYGKYKAKVNLNVFKTKR